MINQLGIFFTGGPWIARKFIQKILRVIRNLTIWIFTHTSLKVSVGKRKRTFNTTYLGLLWTHYGTSNDMCTNERALYTL